MPVLNHSSQQLQRCNRLTLLAYHLLEHGHLAAEQVQVVERP